MPTGMEQMLKPLIDAALAKMNLDPEKLKAGVQEFVAEVNSKIARIEESQARILSRVEVNHDMLNLLAAMAGEVCGIENVAVNMCRDNEQKEALSTKHAQSTEFHQQLEQSVALLDSGNHKE